MQKKKKLVSLKLQMAEATDLATRALASLTASIPIAYEPISYLFASGALFTSQSIVRMGVEIQDFLKSKEAKREAERTLPHRKLYETLKFLHNSPTLDDDFVEALRNLHILTFAENVANDEIAEVYILLETARKLSGPEVSILLATYRIKNNLYSSQKMQRISNKVGNNLNTNHTTGWAKMVAEACGYSLPEYVESQQGHLEELRLIVPRNHNEFSIDGRGNEFSVNKGSRLTDFGGKLAEYIARGEKLFEKI